MKMSSKMPLSCSMMGVTQNEKSSSNYGGEEDGEESPN
jgi:hypothetical protein